jgi:hypothetical protein
MANNPQMNDFLRGLGAGLSSYNPNNMFAGAGAAISASTESRQEREARDKSVEDQIAEFDRRLKMTRAAQQEDIAQERKYRKEDITEERKYQKEDAEDNMTRALRQLQESLKLQRESAASQRVEIKAERGGFNAMDIDRMLYDALGNHAPRYAGSPRGSSVPKTAWGGGTAS